MYLIFKAQVKERRVPASKVSMMRALIGIGLLWAMMFSGSVDQYYVIRVGLERQAAGKTIFIRATQGGMRFVDPETGKALGMVSENRLWKVSVSKDQLKAEPAETGETSSAILSKRLTLEPVGNVLLEAGVNAQSMRPYRGSLEWTRVKESLTTVNWVRLDDYLKSALPAEIPSTFHPEALKAQVVAARSYTLRRLNRHREQGYDLCDGEHCQVYIGARSEKASTTQAVEQTLNEVLVYEGRVIEAVYSSDCGGHTASNAVAGMGRSPVAYLTGAPDWTLSGESYCAGNPNRRWSLTLTKEAVQKLFPKAGEAQEVAVLERATAGQVTRVRIKGKKGEERLTGAELRVKLGTTRLRSLMFTLEAIPEGWQLHGQGAGHGVGLCQWGAQGRALSGQTYDEILKAYYKGANLIKWTP
ncbi:MAG: SpoIID/LytB domain-containing protein [Fimbriimonadia bacterium]|nr:SpoIID/LytB domain-containing protein [Fimbriimonadia bacterium]